MTSESGNVSLTVDTPTVSPLPHSPSDPTPTPDECHHPRTCYTHPSGPTRPDLICVELAPVGGMENDVSFAPRTWTKSFYSGLTLRISTDSGQTWQDPSSMVRDGRFPQFIPGSPDDFVELANLEQ